MNKEELEKLAAKHELPAEVVDELAVIIQTAIAQGISEGLEKAKEEELEEAKIAMKAELTAQAEHAATLYMESIEQRLVEQGEYKRMEKFVKGIQEAFSAFGIQDDSQSIINAAAVREESLQAEIDALRTKLDENECKNYLLTKLTESNLTMMQRGRLERTLAHTKPSNIFEFKSIVDTLISDLEIDNDDSDFGNDDYREYQTHSDEKSDKLMSQVLSYLD